MTTYQISAKCNDLEDDLTKELTEQITRDLDFAIIVSVLQAAGVDVESSKMTEEQLTAWLVSNCIGEYTQYGSYVVFESDIDRMYFNLQKNC